MREKTDEAIHYDINSTKTKESEKEIPMLIEVKMH